MPKSKRAQKISLTRTKGKGHARKETLLEEVRVCCDTFSACYAFDAANMRNTALKEVRVQLRGSRLFFGRTKLLTAALGRTPESEFKDGLSEVAASLAGGEAGLIFTNEPHATVERVLKETQTNEFARAGRDATDDVELEAGPITQFPHNMEPYLRKLGLPTKLDQGTVIMLAPYTVCRAGEPLNSDQAKLLQLLGIKMALFKLRLRCRWSKDGEFQTFANEDEE